VSWAGTTLVRCSGYGGAGDGRSVTVGRKDARDGWEGKAAVAEETEFAMGASAPVPVVVQDVVPLGEADVSRGEPVHALDGAIGRVEGLRVDPGDHRVTHVLLQEGHLRGRRDVVIPASAVTKVENGIWLNLTKEQVENLPAAD
jgi:hypothetical protein